ncbi:hypothetical protein J7337_004642 [Fusarium musae]|uniref:Uncharacterized protein n=1 Tax=Fusarium musae TaxID=1042133 RepID=A0A9P8IT63_9HYPO|nr:hypothetical protein J7337_004642 [Fusarium musae]KAG9504667.1 hypothetical protein J7337_004642 [Fusarium musae]
MVNEEVSQPVISGDPMEGLADDIEDIALEIKDTQPDLALRAKTTSERLFLCNRFIRDMDHWFLDEQRERARLMKNYISKFRTIDAYQLCKLFTATHVESQSVNGRRAWEGKETWDEFWSDTTEPLGPELQDHEWLPHYRAMDQEAVDIWCKLYAAINVDSQERNSPIMQKFLDLAKHSGGGR